MLNPTPPPSSFILLSKSSSPSNLNASSAQSTPSQSSISLPPSSPSTVDQAEFKVDLQLVEALGGKDRLYVLRVADEMEGLIDSNLTNRPPLSFNPSTSFHRRIVYQCAQYLGLLASSDGSGKPILVRLPSDGTRLVLVRRIIDISPLAPPTAPFSNVPPTGFKIMRRDPMNGAGSPMRGQSPASEPGEVSRRTKTFEERQAEYEEARERIFSLSKAGEGGGGGGGEIGRDDEPRGSVVGSKAVAVVPPRSRASSTSSTDSVPVIFANPLPHGPTAFRPTFPIANNANALRPSAPEFDPSGPSFSPSETTSLVRPSTPEVVGSDGGEYASVVFPSVTSSSASSVSNSRALSSSSASASSSSSPSVRSMSHSLSSSSRPPYSASGSQSVNRPGGQSSYRPPPPHQQQPQQHPYPYRLPTHQQTYPPATAPIHLRPSHQAPQGTYVAAQAFYQPPGGGQAYVFIPTVPYDTGQGVNSHQFVQVQASNGTQQQQQPSSAPPPSQPPQHSSAYLYPTSPQPAGTVQQPILVSNPSYTGYVTPAPTSSPGASTSSAQPFYPAQGYQPQIGGRTSSAPPYPHHSQQHGQPFAQIQMQPGRQKPFVAPQPQRFTYQPPSSNPQHPQQQHQQPPPFTTAHSASSVYTQHRSSDSSVSSYNGDGLSRPPSRGSTHSSGRLSFGASGRQGAWATGVGRNGPTRRCSGNGIDRPSSPSSTISSTSRVNLPNQLTSIPAPKDHPLPPRPDWSVGNQQYDLKRPDPILPSTTARLNSSDFPPLAGGGMNLGRRRSDPKALGGDVLGLHPPGGIWNGGRLLVVGTDPTSPPPPSIRGLVPSEPAFVERARPEEEEDDFEPRQPVWKASGALYDPSAAAAAVVAPVGPGGYEQEVVAAIEAKLANVNLGLASSLKTATGAEVVRPVVGPAATPSLSAPGSPSVGRPMSYSSIVRRT